MYLGCIYSKRHAKLSNIMRGEKNIIVKWVGNIRVLLRGCTASEWPEYPHSEMAVYLSGFA